MIVFHPVFSSLPVNIGKYGKRASEIISAGVSHNLVWQKILESRSHSCKVFGVKTENPSLQHNDLAIVQGQ